MSHAALRVTALTKTYGRGEGQVRALRGVDLSFASSSVTAVMGPSGCGKSTFLHTSAGNATAIALYDATNTQYGAGSSFVSMPPAIITAQITPAVFCASLPPWPTEYKPAEIN